MLLFPKGDTGIVLLHKKCRVLAVYLPKHRKQIGEGRIGDPHLNAVEEIVAAIRGERSGGLQGERIGAGVRFAEGKTADPLTACQLGQIAPLLIVVAKKEEREGCN